MSPSLRTSGIPSLPELPWGTHLCLFFRDRDDLLDLLVPFFAAGLRAGEAGLWVTGAPLSPEVARAALCAALPEADAALRDGRLEVLDLRAACLDGDGRFDPQRALEGFERRVERFLAAGFPGVRSAGLAWALPAPRDLLLRYELALGERLRGLPVLNACGHPLEGCSPEAVLDAIRVHDLALFRREGRWELAQHALQASEQKYRLLFENMASGFAYHRMVCDAEGRPVDYVFLEMNPAFERQTGLRREATLGRRVTELLPALRDEDFDWIGVYGRVALSGEPVRFERFFAPLQRWFAITAYCPVPGDFAVLTSDITEAKRTDQERETLLSEVERARQYSAELAARELQRAGELEAIFEATHVQLALLDPDFDFLLVNSSYARGCGHSKEELIGRNHFELFPDADNQAIFERARDRNESFYATEKPFEFADQPERGISWWNWSLVPLPGPDGRPQALLLSLLDVSEAVLARQRAEQLRDEARAQAVLRERLMAILGHDLRQPLNVITASAGAVLRKGELGERDQRAVERIERNARRIEAMIRDLLDYTRSRAGSGIPVRPEAADLRELTGRVVEELHAAHPGRSLRLDVEGDCQGRWDGERLLQVLGNLLTNALQHGDPSEPVDLRVRGGPDAVRLEVHNRGEPIPAAALPQVFEPFRQGAVSGHHARGLGLGLYIVREILAAHGGSVAVSSSAGEGTTFSVHLPKSPSGALPSGGVAAGTHLPATR